MLEFLRRPTLDICPDKQQQRKEGTSGSARKPHSATVTNLEPLLVSPSCDQLVAGEGFSIVAVELEA